MNATIKDHLAFLYGKAAAGDLEKEVEDLLGEASDSRESAAPAGSTSLTEADCMLITYGDQVRAAEGLPPLQTLTEFLSARATAVSAVHILPFYPSSSDDGFSVMDYYKVDHAIGTWSNVEALETRFDRMFHEIFNHA